MGINYACIYHAMYMLYRKKILSISDLPYSVIYIIPSSYTGKLVLLWFIWAFRCTIWRHTVLIWEVLCGVCSVLVHTFFITECKVIYRCFVIFYCPVTIVIMCITIVIWVAVHIFSIQMVFLDHKVPEIGLHLAKSFSLSLIYTS